MCVWGSEFVLCVQHFGVGLGVWMCAVCWRDWGGFGGLILCCVWDSLGRISEVSLCCVWERMVWVWGSEFVLCVGQFVVCLGD